MLLVMRSPLHSMVDFPGLYLWQRLSGVLIHLPLGVDVDRAVFGTMVSFFAMVHAVQGSRCVWASALPTTSARSSTSLVAWGGGVVLWSRVLESVWCRGT
jgi:hypothetical protein